MSETTETEGTPATEPEPPPAAESTPDTTADAPEQTPEQKQEAGEEDDRRIAQLRARLGAAERERERQAVELEVLRRQTAHLLPAEETPEQRHQRERAEIRAEVEHQIRTERFHTEGMSAFGDWERKCDDLVKMGADPGFAQLLVEMPEGVKVAAALADDPAEVQRIANIRTERGRAIALGKYAATLDASDSGTRAARPAPQVTRAPAPIRPVTGRTSPQASEYQMPGQQLVELYAKQAMDAQRRR